MKSSPKSMIVAGSVIVALTSAAYAQSTNSSTNTSTNTSSDSWSSNSSSNQSSNSSGYAQGSIDVRRDVRIDHRSDGGYHSYRRDEFILVKDARGEWVRVIRERDGYRWRDESDDD